MGATTDVTYSAPLICQEANAQAGNQLTFSSLGEMYNNATSGTTQAICTLPGLEAKTAMKEVVAVVNKSLNVLTDPSTTCTMRIYTPDMSVVFSDGPVTTPCNTAFDIPNLGGGFYRGNIRCYLGAKVGSATASIASVREANFNW